MVQKYNDLHGALGGKGQLSKNSFFYWQKLLDAFGKLQFHRLDGVILVDNIPIPSLPLTTPVKSLEVTSTSQNDWSAQFNIMTEKIKFSV